MKPAGAAKPVRAGVVGVGHMGLYHAIAYSQIMNVTLAGIADPDDARVREVAGQVGTEAYTDYRELFGKVDVVSLAVPTPLHHAVASEFLQRGIHVLVEKPIAPTLDEARDLFRIAGENGVILHVGHVERFNGAVRELSRIVRDPQLIESRRIGPFTQRAAKDDVVIDLMIHDIDIVLSLVGEPVVGLEAFGAKVHGERHDAVTAILRFPSGCIASLIASRISEHKKRTMAVSQPGAYVFLDYTDQDIHIHRQASSATRFQDEELRYQQASLIEQVFVHKDNPLKLELLHFIDCAANDGQRLLPVEQEIMSLDIALRIVETLERGAGKP
jgi:predicted dehydrogenase